MMKHENESILTHTQYSVSREIQIIKSHRRSYCLLGKPGVNTKLRAWSYWYSVFTLFTARGQQSSMLTNTMSSPELAMHISTNMHDAVPGAKQTHEPATF